MKQKDVTGEQSKFPLLTRILNISRQPVSECLALPTFGLNIAAPEKGREEAVLSPGRRESLARGISFL